MKQPSKFYLLIFDRWGRYLDAFYQRYPKNIPKDKSKMECNVHEKDQGWDQWKKTNNKVSIFTNYLCLNLFPLELMYSGLVTNPLGTSVAESHHLFSDISKLRGLRDKSNVWLTKIVSITAVTQLLELEVLIVLVAWQVLQHKQI